MYQVRVQECVDPMGSTYHASVYGLCHENGHLCADIDGTLRCFSFLLFPLFKYISRLSLSYIYVYYVKKRIDIIAKSGGKLLHINPVCFNTSTSKEPIDRYNLDHINGRLGPAQYYRGGQTD